VGLIRLTGAVTDLHQLQRCHEKSYLYVLAYTIEIANSDGQMITFISPADVYIIYQNNVRSHYRTKPGWPTQAPHPHSAFYTPPPRTSSLSLSHSLCI